MRVIVDIANKWGLAALGWLISLAVAACSTRSSGTPASDEVSNAPTRPGVRPWLSTHTARGELVTAECEAENRLIGDNRKRFRNCPHWRMAMPQSCGSDEQPSFLDPCHCMCDLCESDSDCAGGRCLMWVPVILT